MENEELKDKIGKMSGQQARVALLGIVYKIENLVNTKPSLVGLFEVEQAVKDGLTYPNTN